MHSTVEKILRTANNSVQQAIRDGQISSDEGVVRIEGYLSQDKLVVQDNGTGTVHTSVENSEGFQFTSQSRSGESRAGFVLPDRVKFTQDSLDEYVTRYEILLPDHDILKIVEAIGEQCKLSRHTITYTVYNNGSTIRDDEIVPYDYEYTTINGYEVAYSPSLDSKAVYQDGIEEYIDYTESETFGFVIHDEVEDYRGAVKEVREQLNNYHERYEATVTDDGDVVLKGFTVVEDTNLDRSSVHIEHPFDEEQRLVERNTLINRLHNVQYPQLAFTALLVGFVVSVVFESHILLALASLWLFEEGVTFQLLVELDDWVGVSQ